MDDSGVADAPQLHVIQKATHPAIEISSFGVRIPSTIIVQGQEEELATAPDLENDRGIVGTITIMGNSVMVWFGWGQLVSSSNTPTTSNSSVGTGK